MEAVDLLITHARQLCIVPPGSSGPQRGRNLGELGLIEDGALAIHDGLVVACGSTNELLAKYVAREQLDASDRLVTPGLVDPHTHLIWAGDRAAEFERRITGVTYQQIMAEGGGIAYTTHATRNASLDELIALGRARLETALQHGTTTIEIKTGYGLETATEIKMLEAIAALSETNPVRIVPTFIGAHAVPAEYAGRTDAYVDLVIREMIPAVAEWKARRWPGDLYCDVFCEDGAFDLDQTRRILEAARAAGMKLKVHVDEFKALGGTSLGVELGAVSLDHLDVTPDHEIALLGRSDTVAVALPTTPFGLGQCHFTPVQKLLDAGAIVALATDCNPGPAWTENMQFVMALAGRYLRLTPGQALVASTLNAACALDLGDQAGSLAPGYAADAIIWKTGDYRDLGYHFGVNQVDRVLIGGTVVYEAP